MDPSSIFVFEFTMRYGYVAGLIGVFIWFMAMEILEFDENKIKNIFVIRFIYLLIGLTIGLNLLTLGYEWNPVWGNYDLSFKYELGFYLTPIIYSFYLIHQFTLFYFRTRKFDISTISSLLKLKKLSIISYIYYISVLITIITFTLGGVGLIPSFTWIVFGSISQLAFSYFLLKIPLILLASEIPAQLIILSNKGVSIYSEKFDKSLNITEQLLAGYLTAINQIGTSMAIESGDVTKINVGEEGQKLTIIFCTIDSVKFCYVYRGSSYYSITRLENFAKSIHENEELWIEIKDCLIDNRVLLERKLMDPYIDDYFKDYLDN